MNNALVLTVIGPDHPGIVDDLSRVIAENGANWLESRMCNLAGQFAGVLLIDCPAGNCSKLQKELETLDAGVLDIQVTFGNNDNTGNTRELILLEISGPDHPGIVHDISHFLAARDINIVEIDSHCEEGAMSGGYVFHSRITASVPKSQVIENIENALDGLASELHVEIILEDQKGMKTRI